MSDILNLQELEPEGLTEHWCVSLLSVIYTR